MNELLAAIAFLTQLPVERQRRFDSAALGRAAAWFPLVGLIIGGFYLFVFSVLTPVLPVPVVGGFIVIVELWVTGGLHVDGLADTADGFGGGWSKAQVLKIMQDPATGSYGTAAIVLLIVLKVSVIGALAESPQVFGYLLAAPVLGRWSSVSLSYFLPYARTTETSVGALSRFVTVREFGFSSFIAIGIALLALGWNGIPPVVAVITLTTAWGALCRRRIDGVTGDTLGAGIVSSELLVLVVGVVE